MVKNRRKKLISKILKEEPPYLHDQSVERIIKTAIKAFSNDLLKEAIGADVGANDGYGRFVVPQSTIYRIRGEWLE